MNGSSIVAIFFLGKKGRVKYGSIVWHTAVGLYTQPLSSTLYISN
jgi:hypothetical protein